MILRNILFIGIAILVTGVSLFGVAVIDSLFGLHRILVVGDVDLALVAFACSLLFVYVSYKIQKLTEFNLKSISQDFIGVGLCVLSIMLPSMIEENWFDGSLASAYFLSFIAVSGILFTTYIGMLFLLRSHE